MARTRETEAPPSENDLETRIAAAAERIRRMSTRPPDPRTPEQKLADRLNKAETLTEGNNRRRIRLLLRQAGLYAAAERYSEVYAVSLEVAHLARVQVVGYTHAYPVLAAQTRRLSELPAPGEGEDQPP